MMLVPAAHRTRRLTRVSRVITRPTASTAIPDFHPLSRVILRRGAAVRHVSLHVATGSRVQAHCTGRPLIPALSAATTRAMAILANGTRSRAQKGSGSKVGIVAHVVQCPLTRVHDEGQGRVTIERQSATGRTTASTSSSTSTRTTL